MYIIASGQVEILKRDAYGDLHTALFLGEGQIFGELALLDQGLRTATVIASDDPTIVFALKRETFESVCRSDTALGYQLMRNLALDLAFKLRHHNLDN
jgi:CRP-like cAMP-binding protein